MEPALAEKIVHGLKAAGIDFITYLPESRLSQILPLLREDGTVQMVATASEQEAITIAAGAALGGKRVACYMESTGPYVSAYSLLTVGKQMGVPILLLIGFLGSFADQRNSFLYVTIGMRMIPTLEGLGLEYRVIENADNLERHIKDAQRVSDSMRAPAALIFSGGVRPMIRRDCLELIAPLMTDQLVLSSQSGQRIEWFHLSKHEGNLLVGMMGCATGVGMGLALALPHRRVIVLESDGSVLLSLFNLPTLGNLNLSNLTVFVFDNEVYSGSTMSEPTATAGKTDLAAIARASGNRKRRHRGRS